MTENKYTKNKGKKYRYFHDFFFFRADLKSRIRLNLESYFPFMLP
jgi:hypothetical protein